MDSPNHREASSRVKYRLSGRGAVVAFMDSLSLNLGARTAHARSGFLWHKSKIEFVPGFPAI